MYKIKKVSVVRQAKDNGRAKIFTPGCDKKLARKAARRQAKKEE